MTEPTTQPQDPGAAFKAISQALTELPLNMALSAMADIPRRYLTEQATMTAERRAMVAEKIEVAIADLAALIPAEAKPSRSVIEWLKGPGRNS